MQKTALITGAAQGLGEIISGQLLAAGYRVVMTDANQSGVEAAAKALSDDTARVMALKLDVLDKQQFIDVQEAVANAWGPVDVLVNNAAMTPTTSLFDITPEEFSQVVDINLRGTFLACQVIGKTMMERGTGRIINLASLAGQMGGVAAGAHYASSKAGIVTLTKIFARNLAGKGVTVNAIAPGPVDLATVREKVPADKLEHIIQNVIPVQALSDPAFIGQMVVMLASDGAATVTGATWDINGGMFMR
ncbi:SDR family NAD(P)-dependent oxidoreductase [Alteromonas lipolytica]|uniref:3-oxoacyl-ACP reductase n=1 Tax=Alteromonas lipolytica TaxID=1856405 RepID=A0A1E8FAS1_9ALTE|nr:SDR family NAD(P)-dependent oxidoreductase [Alteromonas lipolytica]OFI33011.1 3-oxoacyl-ACP reductase [Alteromonas lipolytica]GGF63347.1 3-oxoacyl-ACP reductase [Alteromonas lipolytica]